MPLLKEAPPKEILVFPLVIVEDPRDVVLLPRLMEEFPRASLLFPLFMVVLPRVKAVFPSVKLVLPIEEKLVFLTQIQWWGLGLTRPKASHAHAAHPALQALGVNSNISWDPEQTRMLSMDSATPVSHNAFVELVYVGFGRPHTTHVSCEWTEAAVGGRSLSGGTGTVERLSHRYDDTGRLKDTLLQRGQSAVTSLSSEPLFPIASDCKTFPLCTAVCTICRMSCTVSVFTDGRLKEFTVFTCIQGFDCTSLVLISSIHLKYGCGSFTWYLFSTCIPAKLFKKLLIFFDLMK